MSNCPTNSYYDHMDWHIRTTHTFGPRHTRSAYKSEPTKPVTFRRLARLSRSSRTIYLRQICAKQPARWMAFIRYSSHALAGAMAHMRCSAHFGHFLWSIRMLELGIVRERIRWWLRRNCRRATNNSVGGGNQNARQSNSVPHIWAQLTLP